VVAKRVLACSATRLCLQASRKVVGMPSHGVLLTKKACCEEGNTLRTSDTGGTGEQAKRTLLEVVT
jgi:hypothetical protein